MNKFWNFVPREDGETELYLEGTIAEESWFDDDITPEEFKAELKKAKGNIRVVINSPGGDCVAASVIYTALMEWPHDVTVFITGLAASAASVIAMAGTKVVMSPTAMMMIHNPWTIAMGDKTEMKRAAQLLDEVKESIVNAYEIKTNLPRTKIETLMDNETWFSAYKAKELGFCDEVAYAKEEEEDKTGGFLFSGRAAAMALMDKVKAQMEQEETEDETAETETAGGEITGGETTACALSAEDIKSDTVQTEEVKDMSLGTTEINDRVNAADLKKRLALIKNY